MLLLRRCLHVVAHELGHLFGINHCVYYSCTMNGANSLAETDRQPLRLCPIDLKKLDAAVNHAVGNFDPLRRFVVPDFNHVLRSDPS